MLNNFHIPVLLSEAINGLQIKPDGIYIDCTFGGGGHAKEILKRLNDKGKLIAFDQDEAALKNNIKDERLIFVSQNFMHLQRFLKLHGITKADGILADLGVSSYQFDEQSRGFSTRFDGPLDMRMNLKNDRTAADILQNYSEQRLHKMFEQFGEVTNAKTLAKYIVQQRTAASLQTTGSFKNMISPMVKGNPHKYFAQVFQALRIEVNEEIESLKALLGQIPDVLNTGGRVSIITFHSIEDRIVKNFFRQGSVDELIENPFERNEKESPFKVITKKPITPSEAEIKNNPRSRSAKLRIIEME